MRNRSFTGEPMSRTGEVSFTDEVMSGGRVCRRYSDGVEEWRWRDPDATVWWRVPSRIG
jgi:hypothetical protein